MFEERYLIMETIGRHAEKLTSIVKDKNNQYFIAKRVRIDDPKTMHEINFLKALTHPNIIRLHEIIPDQHHAYIIEEYCEEGDLEYYLKRHLKMQKKVPEEVVARWIVQLLLAVQYLHHSKIIHRDIRPRNIFLTSTGNIKLGSFKASKQLEKEANYAQTLINSSYYMTPELMQGKKYDCKVDIWAIGCVLYEMCTLKPLLNVFNLADLVSKVSSNAKIDELPLSYSKQLNTVYLKCMKRNPNERASASELLKTAYFLAALQKFISDEGLNIALHEKIPIKKYKIHRYKYERLKIRRGLVKERPSDKKDNLLPKLQLFAKDKGTVRATSKSRGKEIDREQSKVVKTPVLKGSSIGKDSAIRSASTEKKKVKTQVQYKSRDKRKTQQQNEGRSSKLNTKEPNRQYLLAPPMLPKPLKPNDKEPKRSTPRVAKTEEQIQPFQTTMSKESLSRELANFQKKELKEINEGLNKMFEEWNIGEEQEVEFDFEEESELRLTAKSSQTQAASLLKAAKSKLEQFVEELNYKYCPDMQPITEKTVEFDSNSLSQFRFARNP